jgi:hypothetical protein
MSKTFDGYVYVLEVTEGVGIFAHLFERLADREEDRGAQLIVPITAPMLTALAAVYPPQHPPSLFSRVHVSYEIDDEGRPTRTNQIRVPSLEPG